jgi:hypothetical protein
MTYDADLGAVLLFGGSGELSVHLGDSWSWNGSAWTPLSRTTPPPARWGAALAFDEEERRAVLFGGNNNQLLDDTWAFGPSTPTALPVRRFTTRPARQEVRTGGPRIRYQPVSAAPTSP